MAGSRIQGYRAVFRKQVEEQELGSGLCLQSSLGHGKESGFCFKGTEKDLKSDLYNLILERPLHCLLCEIETVARWGKGVTGEKQRYDALVQSGEDEF